MNASTGQVIRWVLSKPVLARRLAMIARDEIVYGQEELPCMVVDLLDPDRGELSSAFLYAVGAPPAGADTVWRELSANGSGRWHWMHGVDWHEVREALNVWTTGTREREAWTA